MRNFSKLTDAMAAPQSAAALLEQKDGNLSGDLEKKLSSAVSVMEKKADEVKEHAEKVLQQAENFGKETVAEIEKANKKADEAMIALNQSKEELAELAQKVDSIGTGSDEKALLTLGDRFVQCAEQKEYSLSDMSAGQKFRADIENKTVLLSDLGRLAPEESVQGPFPTPNRRLTIRALLNVTSTTASTVPFVVEDAAARVDAAAMVAEGTTKPKSDAAMVTDEESMKTIAHYMKASRQALDDVSVLAGFIDARLRIGLDLIEETQILTGDDIGANLNGLIPQATAYAVPAGFTAGVAGDETQIFDRIRLYFLQAELNNYIPDGFILHPTELARAQLLKDVEGRYIYGSVEGFSNAVSLWGYPGVASQAMPQGKFLVGSFQTATQLWERMSTTVMVSTENQDDFINNLVTVLGERRVALTTYQPGAFIYGDAVPA